MSDGIGCKCAAMSEGECCCDNVDWRSAREVELEQERDHWKANHDTRVEAARLLIERTDIPLERVKAYKRYMELSAQNEALRSALNAMLTEMGMDEDESNKPTYNQARNALNLPTSPLKERTMPVPHSEPHEITVRAEDAPYGCLNRVMQEGYFKLEVVWYNGIPNLIHKWCAHQMSTECRYDRSLSDHRCSTCEHRGKAEAYATALIEKVRQENATP